MPPARYQDLRFNEALENLAVEQPVARIPIERFTIAILLRLPRVMYRVIKRLLIHADKSNEVLRASIDTNFVSKPEDPYFEMHCKKEPV